MALQSLPPASTARNPSKYADYLLTTEEAATFLNIPRQTLAIYRMQKTGPAYHKVGARAIRYTMADLQAYVMSRRVEH